MKRHFSNKTGSPTIHIPNAPLLLTAFSSGFLSFPPIASASLIVYRLYLSLNDKSDFEMPNIVGRSVQSSRASSVGTGP